jgi:phosphohistidine phosphatase
VHHARVAKTLYLLRHLKSSWDDPALPDRERPLAPRGLRAGKKLARHLRKSGVTPEVVLCSPAVRTRQTLEAVQAELDGPDVRFPPELYAASDDDLLDALRAVEPDVGSVLLIAHNPGLEDLSFALTGQAQEKFPTGAFATLSLDRGWAELGPGECKLTAFVVPREL